ncbi:MAG TPA: co-chaperone GroES [Candidatus Eisenbacteria bacterium]|jgi:chaperonin GroES|nr:co-chaperone GroES [Candidatus Eisenbacteria bacterium]
MSTDKQKIQPLGDRVLVEPLEAEEKTAGGIVIPDSAKEKQQKGKVIAVGKGRVAEDGKVTPLEVKAGDQVLYGRYAGTEVKVGANDYLIVKEDDILGIIR